MKCQHLFFFLLLTTFAPQLHSQINWSDSRAQAITYWNIGDTLAYEVALEKIKIQDRDTSAHETIMYDVIISVIDSTADSYLVEWAYQNFQTEGVNPLTARLAKIFDNIQVRFQTDEMGTIQQVINWEKVRDYSYSLIDQIISEAGQVPQIRAVLEAAKSPLASELGIRNSSIQDAQQFHSFYGVAYSLGEILRGEIDVPNLYFPGETMNGKFELELTEIDRENESYTLRYEQIVDPDDLRDVTIRYLRTLDLSEEAYEEIDKVGELSNTVSTQSEFHDSGWILNSRQEKNIRTDGNINLEIRTILLKD